MDSWKEAVFKTLGEIGEYCKNNNHLVDVISITSQRASIIPIDKNNNPLHRAIMWQDKRSVKESEHLSKELGDQNVYEKTGLRVDSYFSAPKIMWLKNNKKDIFEKASKFIGVQDYVAYLLTKTIITDPSQATRTLMMNLNSKEWDQELLKLVGINSSNLPTIVESASVCGYLDKNSANQVGLKEGIPVVLAGGDQACAAMALGMVEPGVIVANTGTGAFTLGFSNKPKLHPKQKTLCSAGPLPGSYFIEAGLITGGILNQWFVEQFYKGLEIEESFAKYFKEIEASPVGSNGVVALPHFKGASAPYWNPKSKGTFFNITLSTTRADMGRSVLEGVALEMGLNFALIKNLIGNEFKGIAIGGGMTRRDIFNQMQADIYNHEVSVAESTEATSLGAWMSAMVAIKEYSDHKTAYSQIVSKSLKSFGPNSNSAETYKNIQMKRELLYNSLNHNPALFNSFYE